MSLRTIKTRQVGNTALKVSELGLGGAAFGNLYQEISSAETNSIIHYLLDNGINYLDSAPYYGFGLSEKRIGKALGKQAMANTNKAMVLSTKVGRVLEPISGYAFQGPRDCFFSHEPYQATFDYSYDGIMRSFESSLQRLKVDRVELLLVHDIGAKTHEDKNPFFFQQLKSSGYKALQELKRNDNVSAIGLGVNEVDACVDAMQWGSFDCFLLAGRYSLLEQQPLDEFFPLCQQYGASVIAGGIYNSGILASDIFNDSINNPFKYSQIQLKNLHYNYQTAPADVIDKVMAIATVCQAYSVNLAAAAMHFVLAHPVISSVIPGMSSLAEAKQNLAYYQQVIPDEFWQTLILDGLINAHSPLPISGNHLTADVKR